MSVSSSEIGLAFFYCKDDATDLGLQPAPATCSCTAWTST